MLRLSRHILHWKLDLEKIRSGVYSIGAMQGALGINLRLELNGMLLSCLLQVHGFWVLRYP